MLTAFTDPPRPPLPGFKPTCLAFLLSRHPLRDPDVVTTLSSGIWHIFCVNEIFCLHRLLSLPTVGEYSRLYPGFAVSQLLVHLSSQLYGRDARKGTGSCTLGASPQKPCQGLGTQKGRSAGCNGPGASGGSSHSSQVLALFSFPWLFPAGSRPALPGIDPAGLRMEPRAPAQPTHLLLPGDNCFGCLFSRNFYHKWLLCCLWAPMAVFGPLGTPGCGQRLCPYPWNVIPSSGGCFVHLITEPAVPIEHAFATKMW